MKKKEVLLTFPEQDALVTSGYGPEERSRWSGQAQMPFRPLGMLVWGASDATSIEMIRMGNLHEGTASGGAMPARFFEEGRSFSEIERLVDANELKASIAARKVLTMGILDVGSTLMVEMVGPFSRFCMWGNLVNTEQVTTLVEIMHLQAGGFRGRIAVDSFDEETLVLDVRAPTSECCATVIAASLSPTSRRGLY
jgi:hypothetical protein